MDARQYLAKKGLNLDKDDDKPNTLEELAWSRAREAGQHRPRSGTPHDWEDWERYHDTLAEGAEELGQKINHQAHLHYLNKDDAEANQRELLSPLKTRSDD
ncbi:hypothetical protein SAMN05192555_102363 [Franzmannia pantelleriensis]|uniref:Uncharacterized protein n=1 Tax=Franzmannia pantelleriensis TaxID=48727 RepID=A0A1G9H6F9_9GAMM|nr:hypothetical protein SAMN05192555_102363 [Halomonas pantelleriensis]